MIFSFALLIKDECSETGRYKLFKGYKILKFVWCNKIFYISFIQYSYRINLTIALDKKEPISYSFFLYYLTLGLKMDLEYFIFSSGRKNDSL